MISLESKRFLNLVITIKVLEETKKIALPAPVPASVFGTECKIRPRRHWGGNQRSGCAADGAAGP